MKPVILNQVHVVVHGRPSGSYSSMSSAVGSIRYRVISRRVMELVDEEIVHFARVVFLCDEK